MSLLSKEFEFNTKENWEELSDYQKKISSPFYRFIINFYSKRVEENMSFENCIKQFQNDYSEVGGDSMVKDFLVFKNIYLANFEFEHKNLEGVLYISNLFGFIDQYLIVIEVIFKLIAQDESNDKIIINFLKKLDPLLLKEDNIFNIVNLLDAKKEIIVLKNSAWCLPIINAYTLGNFKYCIDTCKEKISEFPLVFEMYEIYCKSLINSNLDFIPTGISPLIDKILISIFKVLLFNNDSVNHKNKLLKYSLVFLSFDFGKQLFAFSSLLNGDSYSNYHSLIGCLSSSINNPRLLSLNLLQRNDIIYTKSKKFHSLPSFKANLQSEINKNDLFLSDNNLQSDIYLSRKYFRLKKYNDVIETLKKYLGIKIPAFYYDNVLSLLFESYLILNNLIEAMQIASSILVDSQFYTNRINIANLIEKIKDRGIDNFAQFIELPIIFRTVAKDYDLYEAYIEFMIYNDQEYPSKLNIESLIEHSSYEKTIYFLKKVCTVSTMQYSLEFSSAYKAEQERHNICIILKELDVSNSQQYTDEISEILRNQAVRKAIKEVDDGRLYVNIESLKNRQLNNLIESFNRYKEIELTNKDKILIGFNASKERNWNNPEFQNSNLNPELNNLAYLAFKSIYLEARDNFLYSKEYGLDSCLSGRIRHGTLKNLLRSVFEKLNLITAKSGDIYSDNLYWQDQFYYTNEYNITLQERLKFFSKEIDNLTTQIVDSLIQIKTENNTEKLEGLFDFSTTDVKLNAFYKLERHSFDSYSTLITKIYFELAATTSLLIVPYVQRTLTDKIKKDFQRLIEQLQIDIRNYGISSNELLTNISKSSTDIQIELDNAAKWFTFNTTDSSSLLDLETILNASKELTNKFNPNCCIEPELIYPKDVSIVSSSAMIFVFNILMDNIIKHSNLSAEELDVKIMVNAVKEFIEIKVVNNISSHVNVENTFNRLSYIKDNWNNHQNIDRSSIEGGSGFDKIKRILLYEAYSKTERFEFSVSSGQVSVSLFLLFNQLDHEQNINN